MRRALLLIFMVLPLCAAAQDPYRYFYNDSSVEEDAVEIASDEHLFFVPLIGEEDIFTQLSRFNFSWIKYSRRGYDRTMNRATVGDIRLYGLVSAMPDYQILSEMGRSGMARRGYSGLGIGESVVSGVAGFDFYTPEMRSLVREGMRFSVGAQSRKAMASARFSHGTDFGRDGYYGLSFSGRWGRDMHIDGIETNENTVLAGQDFRLAPGHTLTWIAAGSFARNTLRSYTTAEVFALTGDNYYNPSWGYYGGDKVSANTLDRENALLAIVYTGRLTDKTTLSAALSYRAGQDRRGALSWFDAQNPYPDYYRYLPSYETSNPAASWVDGDTRVTQIFWEQMVEQNLGRGDGQAAYLFDKKTERIGYLQGAVTMETALDEGFTLTVGTEVHHDVRHRFKQLASAMHARTVYDIDQYLLDDDMFGDMHLNNLRDPSRLVRRGDRYGYDYGLSADQVLAKAILNYSGTRLRVGVGLEAGYSTLQRNGHYEKEIFPANGSYGRSKRYAFNPFTMKATVGYSFSARHFVDAAAMVSDAAPFAGSIFLNPDYNNAAIGKPTAMRIAAGEVSYAAVLPRLNILITAYATRSSSETAVYRYWDDIASAYCDMSVSGIAKLYRGVELSGHWVISPRFGFRFAASLGRATYDSDPDVTILNDATHAVIVSNAKSYVKGYRLATAPDHALTGELQYNSWGWLATLSASYAAGRYVDITPLRRMERAFGLAESPEMRREFTSQEPIGDAFTLDLFLLKSFSVKNGTISAVLSVNNILGNTSTIYNGYEQMRVLKRGSAPNYNWKPFPAKYLYAYGRTFYVSLSYSF